jgi:hypothetical protein
MNPGAADQMFGAAGEASTAHIPEQSKDLRPAAVSKGQDTRNAAAAQAAQRVHSQLHRDGVQTQPKRTGR